MFEGRSSDTLFLSAFDKWEHCHNTHDTHKKLHLFKMLIIDKIDNIIAFLMTLLILPSNIEI